MNQPKYLLRYRRAKIQLIVRMLDYYVHQVRRTRKLTIIAVTGTIGKTSAKVAIAQLLSTRKSVYIKCNNYNSDRMIRLNFFGLESPDFSRRMLSWLPVLLKVRRLAKNFPYDAVVLEMAESRHVSLKHFIARLKPEIAVVTGITPVHLTYFKTFDRVVDAVWGLASLCETIIYNADFTELAALPNADVAKSYGLRHGAVRCQNVRKDKGAGLSVTVSYGNKRATVETQLIGPQSVYALAAAVAVAHELGWTQKQIFEAIPLVTPVPGRLRPLKGINDTLLLDDSFNASPVSMQSALDTLASYKGYRVAVLGSMNELADEAVGAHEEIGVYTAVKADYLITIGHLAKQHLARAAIVAGMDKVNVASFDRANQAGSLLQKLARLNTTFLFKGSQSEIYVEEAIKFLLPNLDASDAGLVRQDRAWKRRKKGYFAEEAKI